MAQQFGSVFDVPQVATPSANPSTSRQLLYFKADGKLYTKSSAGTELLVGPGGGSAGLTVSPSPPSSPAVNDVWIDSDAGTDLSGPFLDPVAVASGLPFYGDGSDGTVTIAGNPQLSRGMMYDSLTVPVGTTLDTLGWPIFVRGTLTVNGTIRSNMPDYVDGMYRRALSGGPVSTGVGNGGAGDGSGLVTGGKGGAGGAGASGAGGAGGGVSTNGSALGAHGPTVGGQANFGRSFWLALTGQRQDSATKYYGGSGGGGGAGNGTQQGQQGGSGGGIVGVFARVITGTGVIHADGLNGTNSVLGNCGGGGGGGGGLVTLWCASLAGTVTVRAAGGTGGVGGGGSGLSGSVGLPGNIAVMRGL